jgi:cytidyltransferase-like protein
MKTVLALGSFDPLTDADRGFLERAQAAGDYLIVGVHHDRHVHAQRGDGHPIHALPDRMAEVSALTLADAVVPSDGHPGALAVAIRPDVFCLAVTGKDQTLEIQQMQGMLRNWRGALKLIEVITKERLSADRSLS